MKSLARSLLYAIPMGLTGLLLGLTYWQLWGVIIAHIMFDVLSCRILPRVPKKV